LLKGCGFEMEEMRLVLPVLRTEQEKLILLYWLDEIEGFVLEHAIQTEAELKGLRQEMEQLIGDPEAFIAMGEVVQIVAQPRVSS